MYARCVGGRRPRPRYPIEQALANVPGAVAEAVEDIATRAVPYFIETAHELGYEIRAPDKKSALECPFPKNPSKRLESGAGSGDTMLN